MMNSVFGKAMEIKCYKSQIDIVTEAKNATSVMIKPSVKTFHILEEDLLLFNRKKLTIFFNKSIYTGFTILDLLKLIMSRFYYVLKPCYGEKMKLLYTDTDSFIFQVLSEDLYVDINDMKEHLDTCDYPVSHQLHSDHNKNVMGKFKDETNGFPIAEFVGLKAKMHSVLNADIHSHCTAKDIKKSVVKQSFHHKLYIDALSLTKCEHVTQKQIDSKNHQLFTVEINKAGLHP